MNIAEHPQKKYYLSLLGFIVFSTIAMNYTFRQITLVWWGSLVLLFVLLLLDNRGSLYLQLNTYFIWYACFVMICALSALFAVSISVCITKLKTLIILGIALIAVCQITLKQRTIRFVLFGYLISSLINAVYVLLTIDLTLLGDLRLGTDILEGWNANGIAFMLSSGALISFYLFKNSFSKKKIEQVFYAIAFFFCSVLTIFTGSRTGVFTILVGIIVYTLLLHPKRVLKNLLIVALIIVGAFALIMEVPMLYNVFGIRLEGFFSLFSDVENADSSALLRETYIKNGWKWFAESPFLGRGINNYQLLNETATGRLTYAHNNLIELAVDLGIVGVLVYYSYYVLLFAELIKLIKKEKTACFLLATLIAYTAAQYGTVSYDYWFMNLLLLLSLLYVWLPHDQDISISNAAF